MQKKIMRCGIMSRKAFMERTIQIAKGEYRPKKNEPKVWFESIKTMAQILSEANLELLRVIEESKPESITALAEITGRKKGNLSRTLKKMQNYGIVDLKPENNYLKPIAKATDFRLDYGLSQ
jgi:predicted transcriptional regulator